MVALHSQTILAAPQFCDVALVGPKLSMQEIESSLNKKSPLVFGIEFHSKVEQPETYMRALHFVATYAPKDLPNHLFSWKGNRSIVSTKSIALYGHDSTSPEGQKVLRDMSVMQAGGVHQNMDALTAVQGQRKNNQIYIYIESHFFLDKIRKTSADESAFMTKLIVAMAHEIYGNIQNALTQDFNNFDPKNNDLAHRKAMERYAFSAGIRFIQNLRNHPDFFKLNKKMRDEFDLRLKEEKAVLASWLR